MSRIGFYKFTTSCELHIVNKMGNSCPINEEAVDTEIEVECVLHCDDPEDGVYAEDIDACLAEDLTVKLSQEAIDLLDLSVEAGMHFMDSAQIPPEVGTKWQDTSTKLIWTVIGGGNMEDHATHYTWLQRYGSRLKPIGMTIETCAFYCTRYDAKTEESAPCWRPVLPGKKPEDDQFTVLGALYEEDLR